MSVQVFVVVDFCCHCCFHLWVLEHLFYQHNYVVRFPLFQGNRGEGL